MANTTENIKATIHQRQYDTWLQIERENGQHIQCSVAHGPLVGGATRLGIFVFIPEDEDSPDVPSFAEDATLVPVQVELEENQEEVQLSAREARLLRDFLNRPEVVALLDQE